MAYVIKRSYGKSNFDYLHAWCEEFGTACMLSIKKALVFETKAEADAAADKAQRECKGADGLQAKGVTFSAVPA
jgi:hypothetical protein